MDANDSIKKKPVLLIVGIAAASLIIIAVIVFIIFFFNKEKGILGAWHNEELKQVLLFEDDNLLDITTVNGTYKATYYFDEESKDGVIIYDSNTISFYLKDDIVYLISPEGEAKYDHGDMKIYAQITTATTSISEESSPFDTMPSFSETSAETSTETSATASDPTSASSETPTSTPTATPTPTPFPSIIPGLTINTDISITVNPLLPILGTSVLGVWDWVDDPTVHFEFYDDDTYRWYIQGFYVSFGTYEYSIITGEGQVYSDGSGWTSFSVDGDTLSIGTSTYERA